MANLKRFGRRLIKAKEKHQYRQRTREEQSTIKAVARARREETEFARKADIESRRSSATISRAVAERELASSKAKATEALRARRAAKRQRVMSEKALRREQLRPILEAPKRIADSIRSAGERMRAVQASLQPKTPVSPIKPTTAARPGSSIDLGLGKIDLGKIDLGLDKIDKI